MIRPVPFALLLAGSMMLALPPAVSAGCRTVESYLMCDGLRPMYRPWYLDRPKPTPRVKPYSYKFESRSSYLGGTTTYRYRDSLGNRYKAPPRSCRAAG